MKRFLALMMALSTAVCMLAGMSVTAMAGGPGVYEIATKGQAPFAAGTRPSLPEVKVGESLALALYKLNDETMLYEPYNGRVTWTTKGYKTDWLSVSDTGVLTGLPSKETRESVEVNVYAIPEDDEQWKDSDWFNTVKVTGKFSLKLDPTELTMKQGEKVPLNQLIHYYIVRNNTSLDIDNVIWDSSDYNTVGVLDDGEGEYLWAVNIGAATITATAPIEETGERVSLSCSVTVTADGKPTTPTDPENPGKPTDPENPSKPDDKPTTPGTSDTTETKESSRTEQKTDNTRAEEAAMDAVKDANDGKTGRVQTYATAAGASVPAVPVKLYGLGASLSVDTMETLAAGKTGLNVNLDNGSAGVLIPAGFQMPAVTGVLGYSLGWQKDPLYTNLMKDAVKGDNAKTEVYKLGGGTLPTTATVTIKTKLTGKVNVYHWNEDTRKATLIASPTAENGKVTFAAKQLGNLILTTGTI